MRLKEQTAAIDRAIGARLYSARRAAKPTQKDLAQRVGLSFQHMKVQGGTGSIAVSTLFLIAEALQQPINLLLPNDVSLTDAGCFQPDYLWMQGLALLWQISA